MVEMENTRLDHDQEVLRLKNLLPKAPPTSKSHLSLESFSFDRCRRQTLILSDDSFFYLDYYK